MHPQSLAFLDRPDNGVARDRTAARGELHRHAFGAADGDAAAGFQVFARFASLQKPPGDERGKTLARPIAASRSSREPGPGAPTPPPPSGPSVAASRLARGLDAWPSS